MLQRLFTYGSLMPGQAYAHLMEDIPGDWMTGTVTGFFAAQGWGYTMGFPAVVLSEQGEIIKGQVFASEHLSEHLARLDEFEGDAYRRVQTRVTLADGTQVSAFVYELHPSFGAPHLAA